MAVNIGEALPKSSLFWVVPTALEESQRANCLSELLCSRLKWIKQVVVVQLLSHVSLQLHGLHVVWQAFLFFTISQSLLKLMSTESVMPVNHLILCHPLLLLPSIFPSIKIFSSELVRHIRWSKYWSFSFSISPSSEHSGLISFRTNWLDLLTVQGTLKSSPAPQFKSINSFTFCIIYGWTLTSLHDYWKNHSFDMKTFVGQVMSLLFNKLSRFVIVFLPKSKGLFISWLQSLSAEILEPKQICHCLHFSPIYLPWSDGTRCHTLFF